MSGSQSSLRISVSVSWTENLESRLSFDTTRTLEVIHSFPIEYTSTDFRAIFTAEELGDGS